MNAPYVPGPEERSETGYSDWSAPAAAVSELEAVHGYPNKAERIIRGIREVALIVFLLLASLLMVLALSAVANVADAISDSGTTTDACPFGEGQCGG